MDKWKHSISLDTLVVRDGCGEGLADWSLLCWRSWHDLADMYFQDYGSYHHCSRSKSSLEMFRTEERACDSRGIIDQFEISLPEHFEVKVEYTCSPSLVIKKNRYFCRDILALLLVSTLTFVTSILGSDVLTGISLNTWAVSGKHLGHVIPSSSPHSTQHMIISVNV